MSYQIRTATRDDIPALKAFFPEAYGESTVFQDENFLLWYFGRRPHLDRALSCAVAITEDGSVAAHYGYLPQHLNLADGSELTLAWGVSAYTLPQHRAAGLGKALLEHLLPVADVFGVIGFTPKTAAFYETMGFQLFNKKRFKRFVFPLSKDILKITDSIAISRERAEPLLVRGLPQMASADARSGTVRLLDRADIETFTLPAPGRIARIGRDREYLKWRFLENPALNYEILGAIEDTRIKAYLVQRREPLRPTPYFATRIVDVNGDVETLRFLVAHSLRQSMNRNDSFLDFGVFGKTYDPVFESLGFEVLREDDAEILPQVSDPIHARPNHEYLGLFSAERNDRILSLSEDNALFTRADSDRDRAVRVHA